MLQAFQAGAIDIGTVADTPLIFAQAAKQDVVAVAGWATEHGTLGLIASDKSGISSWKDVKGKKIAYQQGTVLQAVLLQGLDDVGLSLKDITPVNLPFTQISPALESGTVDAAILAPPLDTAYLDGHPDAKVVARADDITDRVNFIVAKKSVLEDPAKAAAIRDYIQRLVKARSYIDAHKDDWVQKFYVAQYNLTPEKGRELMDAAGSTTFVDLPGALVDAQQRLADLYHDAGEIPAKIDVAEEFDSRYNAAVAEAQAGQ
jgi:sulfonate transport system substrate-binding protein